MQPSRSTDVGKYASLEWTSRAVMSCFRFGQTSFARFRVPYFLPRPRCRCPRRCMYLLTYRHLSKVLRKKTKRKHECKTRRYLQFVAVGSRPGGTQEHIQEHVQISHTTLELTQATFECHSVGMRIRKTHNLPVVHELVRTPSGEESPAAVAGVPPTAVLVGVAGERTLGLGYEEAIGRYSIVFWFSKQ